MQSIYSWTLKELETIVLNLGFKKYNGEQILRWLYQKRVNSFEKMTNLSKELQKTLQDNFSFSLPEIVKKQVSSDGTIKFLLKLEDGNLVETVLMRYSYGNAVCVSSQVGCNMGCSFCASGLLKKVRDLQVSEMIGQVLTVQNELDQEESRVSHVVIMGIGEPFDNYENVMKFIDIINHPKGMAIGARHITISTCGIIPKIKEFMKEKRQVNLAISLHAPNDSLRSRLMPINKAYPLTELIPVLKEYVDETHRRLTFEYIMLKGINDQKVHAIELAKLLRGINCYVNLIPYNETSHIEYEKSSKERILQFYDTLKKEKINVTIRREFGSKVMAACGQLRSHYEEGK